MRAVAWTVFVSTSVFMFGCGDGTIPIETAPVSGTATYEGKPLKDYRVFFYAADHAAQEPATGRVTEDGSFSLSVRESGDGAIIGNNKVWLKYDPPFEESEAGVDAPIVIPPPTIKIPEKYLDADKSGLTVEVPPEGLTDYKLELE